MIKRSFVVIVIIGVGIFTFFYTYDSLLKDFLNTAKSKEQDLRMYIQSGTQLIDDLAIHGNSFLENGKSNDSKFYNQLKYDAAKNMYTLDAVGQTDEEKLAGNLTGEGKIPDNGIFRDEVNLAFDYNNFFSNYFKKFPDIAWLYYTSENNFINIYPWTSSKNFSFSQDLKSVEFYKVVTPEKNPLREKKWTPVYVDAAGKGLMVTLSKPIYYKDKFMGVVSVDFTNKLLSQLIDSKYETYLFDNTNTVLAANRNDDDKYSVKGLNEYLKISKDELNKFNGIKKDSIELVGNNYIYTVQFEEAPWSIMLVVPVWLIIGNAVLYTMPFLVISLLMLLSMHQIDKRRKSEQQYSKVIETTQDAFWVCDMESRYLQVNDAFCKMIGYSRSELLNMTISDTKSNSSKDKVLNQLNKIKRLGSEHFESTHKCKNGKIITTEVSVTYIPDSRQFCGFIHDISARKQKEQKITFLSYHDALTGLYNRAFFEEECHRLDTTGQLPITVLMGDVNGLKLTNDVFGHAYGDQLLCSIANIIKKCCRSEDIIARIGGDEFCVLLPKVGQDVVQNICDHIYAVCEVTELKVKEGFYHPSVSLGFATKQKQEQHFTEVMREAENSMYKRKLLESKSAHSSIISSIRTTIFEKSNETREHGDRLSSMARKVGEALKLPYDQLSDLELLGAIHDVGKIGVDSHILCKDGTLNEDDWVEIKKHSEIGYRIAKASGELSSVADGILSHHERWDGKGYPQGLSGEQIPISARIIAVVDSFDAMTHERCYRKVISLEEAKKEIAANAGKQFDPNVVKEFLNIVSKEDI